MKIIASVFIIYSISHFHTDLRGKTLESIKVNQLATFAKIYGYVKYFHPSDEAAELDWDAFAIYGTERIIKAKEEESFVSILYELFEPVAPSITIYPSDVIQEFNQLELMPNTYSTLDTIFWQHFGNGQLTDDNTYKSIRVNRRKNETGNNKNSNRRLFQESLRFGEVIRNEIGSNLRCHIPLVLLADSNYTYPIAKASDLQALRSTLNETRQRVKTMKNSKAVFIGNMINLWNSVQHFYPYFNEVSINWNEQLPEAIESCLEIDDNIRFLKFMEELISKLADGHAYFRNYGVPIKYPKVSCEWIENKFIITNVDDQNATIVGSEIVSINGIPIDDVVEKAMLKVPISHHYEMMNDVATEIFKSYGYWQRIKVVYKDSKGAMDTLVAECRFSSPYSDDRRRFSQNNVYKKILNIDRTIAYVNLDTIKAPDFFKNLSVLEKAKAIIIDMRGYPEIGGKDIMKIIGHFIEKKDSSNWFQIPNILYPDRKDYMQSFTETGWRIHPAFPYLNAKIYVLI
ncbi:MAG: hypothetical protein WBA74_06930, partial [Cyclobacteriaceae bacterium]